MLNNEFIDNWGVCGHKKIVQFLKGAIRNNAVSHAYVFTGLSGLGKYTVADRFIKSLLCKKEIDNGEFCNHCPQCKQISAGVHPDLYFVNRQKNEKTEKLNKYINVEQIRTLKGKLQQTVFLDGYKVALIPQAEFLNKSASDALLKALEEPSGKTVIILITDKEELLPQTVVSRCQTVRFYPVSKDQIAPYLRNYYNVDMATAQKLAKISGGFPGRAITFATDKERFDQYNKAKNDLIKLLSSNVGQRLSNVNELLSFKNDEQDNIVRLLNLFKDWEGVLRDLLLFATDNDYLMSDSKTIKISEKIDKNILSLCHRFNVIDKARFYLSENVGSKNVLDYIMINL